VELAFLWLDIKIVVLKLAKYFLDMLLMIFHVSKVDGYVIEVHDNIDIKHISKDSVDKPLEGS